MHVLQFLPQFVRLVNVEIVIARLPKTFQFLLLQQNSKRRCPSGFRFRFLRIFQDTRCFNIFSTVATSASAGLLIGKCTCSGITTYPTNKNLSSRRTRANSPTNRFFAFSSCSSDNRR